ncbi:NAD(P)H-hydrate dehydratase [Psychrobacter sp. Sarcosine-3u-12]|uniref:NAD(P)H-hydrate dehydratase n=1 Tax=Psychrobacter sp. Sarcosine-3u-12 TaxID=2058325 RepID=UPI000C331983|nr:NAD(P)H-hydrate dehydratase [Psychrobacter sp. Sarcosine-3u-12]PKG34728.1 NAD(P)H-hydrate dehydratase [Psychrobacter sp. Sarcosine-3u-12]
MKAQSKVFLADTTRPIALYSSEQVYAMEQAWFAEGYDSLGLMKQAAWQMAQHIERLYEQKYLQARASADHKVYRRNSCQQRASIWVGKGNNGGDGWLIAYYLQQAGWQVQLLTVGYTADDLETDNLMNAFNKADKHDVVSDAKQAQQIALSAKVPYQRFEDSRASQSEIRETDWPADIYIDALFGIGLDRAPEGVYEQAISAFNKITQLNDALAIAVDIPSGLVASTGQVFERIAIHADVTLCLIARKFGLHTKDGMDYSGKVIDIPLIPTQLSNSAATLVTVAHALNTRRQNSYKGSYGHVLVIGGNRINGSQGMGGAAILSASSVMATGAGKITVACHDAFHGALLTSLPDAMTIDLHDKEGVRKLIKEASVVTIGMGLGRDEKAQALFISYVQAAIAEKKSLVIDADGLYHLASLQMEGQEHELIAQLRQHSIDHQVCLTPHSGEAARLLDKKVSIVEDDRLSAIKQCANTYGGDWVLKGAGSLVLEQSILEQKGSQAHVYVCGLGNAGMASAGMGDVLSGVIAGLLAQQDIEDEGRCLHQAVLLHGLAGDILVKDIGYRQDNNTLLIGQRGLQAQDMPAAIRHVMQLITNQN